MAVPVPTGSRRAPGENRQINVRRAPLVSKHPRGGDQKQHVLDEDSEDAWDVPSEIPRRTGCSLHPATFLMSPEVSLRQPVVFSAYPKYLADTNTWLYRTPFQAPGLLQGEVIEPPPHGQVMDRAPQTQASRPTVTAGARTYKHLCRWLRFFDKVCGGQGQEGVAGGSDVRSRTLEAVRCLHSVLTVAKLGVGLRRG